MANFSRDPAAVLAENRSKGYVGVHIEQGVPVLDRDLNLLNDLISSVVRSIFTSYIGNGVSTHSNAFLIVGEGNANDFRIDGPGICLVNGWEVTIEAPIQYSAQSDVAELTTPAADGREDIVFLDVWTSEVTGEDDTDLLNDSDVGMQTSVRRMLNWRVRVAEGSPMPEPEAGHVHYRLATMTRPAAAEITADIVSDERQTRLNLAAMEQRVRLLERLTIAPGFVEPGGQIDPPVQTVGEAVTLHGRNFNIGTPQVRFGTIVADVSSFSATQIVVVVPAGLAGSVRITVTTDGGSVTSDDQFTAL